jgi:hypothetical protein
MLTALPSLDNFPPDQKGALDHPIPGSHSRKLHIGFQQGLNSEDLQGTVLWRTGKRWKNPKKINSKKLNGSLLVVGQR